MIDFSTLRGNHANALLTNKEIIMIQIAASKSAIEGVNHNPDVNLRKMKLTNQRRALHRIFGGDPPTPPRDGNWEITIGGIRFISQFQTF